MTPLRSGWILGPRADACIFSGPILVALGLCAIAAAGGWLAAPVSPLLFLVLIVGVDVAHVYATAFRVYLDPEEVRRRPGVYLGAPLACFAGGVVLYAQDPLLFWRVLAYLAVFHFVRQQWGWMSYARRQAGEREALDRRLDQAAIYAATVYPLIHWHAVGRPFEWFLEGDFLPLAQSVDPYAHALHWLILAAFAARQVQRASTGRGVNWAKLQVLITTWVAWYVGIVVIATDLSFTTLNVLSHGVPYLAVVWKVECMKRADEPGLLARVFRPGAPLLFLGLLVLVGYTEEWFWDGVLWREHAGLFPNPLVDDTTPGLHSTVLAFLVPLLALPQATHYVLDGWIWRAQSNPAVRELFSADAPATRPR